MCRPPASWDAWTHSNKGCGVYRCRCSQFNCCAMPLTMSSVCSICGHGAMYHTKGLKENAPNTVTAEAPSRLALQPLTNVTSAAQSAGCQPSPLVGAQEAADTLDRAERLEVVLQMKVSKYRRCGATPALQEAFRGSLSMLEELGTCRAALEDCALREELLAAMRRYMTLCEECQALLSAQGARQPISCSRCDNEMSGRYCASCGWSRAPAQLD